MDNYYYLVDIQYLGFRYHGWQKQPNVKTVQGMVDKTLCFIFDHSNFKTLGSSRTDAMVSAHHFSFELFMREPVDIDQLLHDLNINLPNDIRALEVRAVTDRFNVIQDAKIKEYIYLFSYGGKNHPFCAPFMVYMQEDLDVELMKEGARLFEGTHSFSRFCYKPSAETQCERTILSSEIVDNEEFTASFFPEHSYIYKISGAGFMRHQVRLMMGALFALGKGDINLKDIEKALLSDVTEPLCFMAPASGLTLNSLSYE